jgi:hypothetical protein
MGLAAGRWQLCVGQPATADYEGHASCLEELVDVPLPVADVVSLHPAKRTRTRISIPIHAGALLAGHRLDVTILPLKVSCARRATRASERCRHAPQWARKRHRTMAAASVQRLGLARPKGPRRRQHPHPQLGLRRRRRDGARGERRGPLPPLGGPSAAASLALLRRECQLRYRASKPLALWT